MDYWVERKSFLVKKKELLLKKKKTNNLLILILQILNSDEDKYDNNNGLNNLLNSGINVANLDFIFDDQVETVGVETNEEICSTRECVNLEKLTLFVLQNLNPTFTNLVD
ncbi:hypothetical protein ACTFIW_004429 [Dictyostelium discoideum]